MQDVRSKTVGVSASSAVNPTSVTEKFWVGCEPPTRAQRHGPAYGKWLVFKPLAKLDEAWHMIRQAVEAGEFGEGCHGAKCSTSRENPNGKAYPGQGVFMVYTTRDAMDHVGLLLIHKVKQTIRYKTDEATMSGLYASRGHKNVTCKTIYWNDGDPSFQKLK